MGALTFDTLAFSRRMEAAGFTRQQAEALAEEQAALIDDRLATKVDLAKTEVSLRTELANVEARLRQQIDKTAAELRAQLAETDSSLRAELAKTDSSLRAELAKTEASLRAEIVKSHNDLELKLAKVEAGIHAAKADLLRWMIGILAVNIGAMTALIKLLH